MSQSKPISRKGIGGRPTLYRPEYVEQAFDLTLLGKTDAQIAAIFGVSQQTLDDWKKSHPEFFGSLTRGKDIADGRVARSLYERATGYSHEAVKIFMPAGAEEPVYAPYTERYPPDTGAASLWLKNRQGANWREKVEHSHTVSLRALVMESWGEDEEVIEGEVVTQKGNTGR
jgi:hypothetical protein